LAPGLPAHDDGVLLAAVADGHPENHWLILVPEKNKLAQFGSQNVFFSKINLIFALNQCL
jgi:hypothetical protein